MPRANQKEKRVFTKRKVPPKKDLANPTSLLTETKEEAQPSIEDLEDFKPTKKPVPFITKPSIKKLIDSISESKGFKFHPKAIKFILQASEQFIQEVFKNGNRFVKKRKDEQYLKPEDMKRATSE